MSLRYTTYMLVLAAGLEVACRPDPSTLPSWRLRSGATGATNRCCGKGRRLPVGVQEAYPVSCFLESDSGTQTGGVNLLSETCGAALSFVNAGHRVDESKATRDAVAPA